MHVGVDDTRRRRRAEHDAQAEAEAHAEGRHRKMVMSSIPCSLSRRASAESSRALALVGLAQSDRHVG